MSKWKKKLTLTQEKEPIYIYPHYHCVVCNKMIEKGKKHEQHNVKQRGLQFVERYCSKECYDKVHGKKSNQSFWKKYYLWIIVAVMIAVVVIFTIFFSK